MNEVPTWVKVVGGVFFPIVITVWLITKASPQIDRTAAAMDHHVVETAVQTALLRAICRNTAKTERQSQFCDEIGVPQWSRE